MRYVVVDASVVVAALMKDGRVRKALFNSNVAFCAPRFLADEVRRLLPKIARRSGKSQGVVASLVEDVLSRLIFVPSEIMEPYRDEALARAKAADAAADEAYVAAALALKAPIWTLDNDFDRVKDLQRLKTGDILTARPVE